ASPYRLTVPMETRPRLSSVGSQVRSMGLPSQLMKTSSATLPVMTGWVGSPMVNEPPASMNSVSRYRRGLGRVQHFIRASAWACRRGGGCGLGAVAGRPGGEAAVGFVPGTGPPAPGGPAVQVPARPRGRGEGGGGGWNIEGEGAGHV